MIKLLVLSGHKNFNSGGVGTHLRVLHDTLEDKGFNHKMVLGKSFIYDLKAFLINKTMKRKVLRIIENQISGLKSQLKKAISDQDEFVDCHDLYAVVAAYRLREQKQYKYKINYTVHAPFYEQYLISNLDINESELNKIKNIESEALSYCDSFVFVDDKQLAIIAKKIGKSIKYLMLPNAVDLKKLATFEKDTQQEEYIVVSRHLFKKNGVHIAIQAFNEAKLPNNVKMLILGMGDEFENLCNLVGNLKLSDRILFKGSLKFEDSINYTINAKMALVPSIPLGDYIEATSLSMLEAMALGTPLIASNIGGLKQVLENTNAGILVEPNDIQCLAKAINELYFDQDLSAFLAKNARKLIVEKYSSDTWLEKKVNFLSNY